MIQRARVNDPGLPVVFEKKSNKRRRDRADESDTEAASTVQTKEQCDIHKGMGRAHFKEDCIVRKALFGGKRPDLVAKLARAKKVTREDIDAALKSINMTYQEAASKYGKPSSTLSSSTDKKGKSTKERRTAKKAKPTVTAEGIRDLIKESVNAVLEESKAAKASKEKSAEEKLAEMLKVKRKPRRDPQPSTKTYHNLNLRACEPTTEGERLASVLGRWDWKGDFILASKDVQEYSSSSQLLIDSGATRVMSPNRADFDDESY